jgi:hypothetical protein
MALIVKIMVSVMSLQSCRQIPTIFKVSSALQHVPRKLLYSLTRPHCVERENSAIRINNIL